MEGAEAARVGRLVAHRPVVVAAGPGRAAFVAGLVAVAGAAGGRWGLAQGPCLGSWSTQWCKRP